jgi:hypothetical protein
MSTPSELVDIVHFQKPAEAIALGARQMVGDLKKRWGVRAFTGTPEQITVDVGHGRGVEVWRRVGDRGGVYELEAAP